MRAVARLTAFPRRQPGAAVLTSRSRIVDLPTGRPAWRAGKGVRRAKGEDAPSAELGMLPACSAQASSPYPALPGVPRPLDTARKGWTAEAGRIKTPIGPAHFAGLPAYRGACGSVASNQMALPSLHSCRSRTLSSCPTTVSWDDAFARYASRDRERGGELAMGEPDEHSLRCLARTLATARPTSGLGRGSRPIGQCAAKKEPRMSPAPALLSGHTTHVPQSRVPPKAGSPAGAKGRGPERTLGTHGGASTSERCPPMMRLISATPGEAGSMYIRSALSAVACIPAGSGPHSAGAISSTPSLPQRLVPSSVRGSGGTSACRPPPKSITWLPPGHGHSGRMLETRAPRNQVLSDRLLSQRQKSCSGRAVPGTTPTRTSPALRQEASSATRTLRTGCCDALDNATATASLGTAGSMCSIGSTRATALGCFSKRT
jgi:hypothetical protein